MLATCLTADMSGKQTGFSLIELTVVLLLVSLVGGLVLPGLANAYSGFLVREEQQRIFIRLGNLGYRAFSGGESIRIEDEKDIATYLDPPEGWKIHVIQPVLVNASGVCLQGELSLVKGELKRDVLISPPYCWQES